MKKLPQSLLIQESISPLMAGLTIGSQEFIEDYVRSKVKTWSSNIAQLSEIAMSQPHASFTGVGGLRRPTSM